jgi:HEAT repeat protein
VVRLVTEHAIQSLKSEKSVDRWRAATGLVSAARAQRAEALSALTDALGDEHPFVRWRAGWSLALARKSAATARLFDELDHGTPIRRAAAADALGYVPKADPEPLVRALSHQDALVRQSAAETLGRLGYHAAVPRFVALLKDESQWVRRAAARALGHIGDASAVGPLSERLSDESVVVQRSAAYALGALRAQEAVSALVAALDSSDLQVRRNAAWGLGRIGNPVALPKLRALSAEPALDPEVIREVEAAIGTIERPAWQQLLQAIQDWVIRSWGRRKDAARR